MFSIVMIARDDQVRNIGAIEQVAHSDVLIRQTLVDQIAGQHDQVGAPVETVEVLQSLHEHPVRIDDVLVQMPGRPDMGVGKLGDEHEPWWHLAHCSPIGRMP